MTTEAAAQAYLADHLAEWRAMGYTLYNPHNSPVDALPVIYGFNNGGLPGCLSAELLAEDGEYLGGHICSSEGYMPHDLGVLEGSRPDRHEVFRQHYPDGYRMDFIPQRDVKTHPGLGAAYQRNQSKRSAADGAADTTPKG